MRAGGYRAGGLLLAQVGREDELQDLGQKGGNALGLTRDEALVGDPDDATGKGVLERVGELGGRRRPCGQGPSACSALANSARQ